MNKPVIETNLPYTFNVELNGHRVPFKWSVLNDHGDSLSVYLRADGFMPQFFYEPALEFTIGVSRDGYAMDYLTLEDAVALFIEHPDTIKAISDELEVLEGLEAAYQRQLKSTEVYSGS